MKLFLTSFALALTGLTFASTTIKIPVPNMSKESGQIVPGFLMVKYKKDVAARIAANQGMRPVAAPSGTSGSLVFQSRLQQSGWIMYRIPTTVDPVAYADFVRKNEPGAINVENVHSVHTLVGPPNDPDFNALEVDDSSGTFFQDFRSNPTPPLSFRRDWHLDDVDALNAWSVWPNQYYTAANKPSNTPLIAMVDSGVDLNHPDWINAGGTGPDISQGGQWDLNKSAQFQLGSVVPNGDLLDHNGHGTCTAGLALASGNNGGFNGHGTLGTGYSCHGMIVKCVQDNGSGLDSDVAGSIMYAADSGADVISVSLGSTQFSQTMQDAVTYANERGSVVVCAGNENGNGGGDLGPIWPAASSGALGVSANGPGWKFASYAGYGWYVDLGAPGGDIQTIGDIFNGDGYVVIQFDWSTSTLGTNYIIDNHLAAPPYTQEYTYLAGTSMACPVVSGGLGNYMNKNNLRQGDWGNIKVYHAVEKAAQSQGAAFGGWEPTNGYGFFDMQALMIDQDSRASSIGGAEGIVYLSGTSIGNVTVRAKKYDPNTGLTSGVTYSTTTQGNGYYRFDGMPPGIYDIWAIAQAARKDIIVNVQAGSDRSGVDFYCGTPVIDSDPPIVRRCNITASSATGLNVDTFAYDPDTRLEDIQFQVLDSGNNVVVPARHVFFDNTQINFAFNTTLPNGAYTLKASYYNGEGWVTVVTRPFNVGPATVPVSGTITLQSYSTSTLHGITMDIRNPGTTTVVESWPLNVHNGSTFTINTTQRGNFDIAFKGAPFLRKVLHNVNITSSGVSGLTPSLTNGDCDGNNSVGTPDFTALRAAWGSTSTSSNWNVNCDLDGNGVVGTSDFNILRANWGAIGDN